MHSTCKKDGNRGSTPVPLSLFTELVRMANGFSHSKKRFVEVFQWVPPTEQQAMAYVEAHVRRWMSTRQAILSSTSGGRETPGERAAKAKAKPDGQSSESTKADAVADAQEEEKNENDEEEEEEEEDEKGEEDGEEDNDVWDKVPVAGPSSSAAVTNQGVINLMVVQKKALVDVNGPDRMTKLLWLVEVLYKNKRRLSNTTPRIDISHAAQVGPSFPAAIL